jgi:hypothetical protein
MSEYKPQTGLSPAEIANPARGAVTRKLPVETGPQGRTVPPIATNSGNSVQSSCPSGGYVSPAKLPNKRPVG